MSLVPPSHRRPTEHTACIYNLSRVSKSFESLSLFTLCGKTSQMIDNRYRQGWAHRVGKAARVDGVAVAKTGWSDAMGPVDHD